VHSWATETAKPNSALIRSSSLEILGETMHRIIPLYIHDTYNANVVVNTSISALEQKRITSYPEARHCNGLLVISTAGRQRSVF